MVATAQLSGSLMSGCRFCREYNLPGNCQLVSSMHISVNCRFPVNKWLGKSTIIKERVAGAEEILATISTSAGLWSSNASTPCSWPSIISQFVGNNPADCGCTVPERAADGPR